MEVIRNPAELGEDPKEVAKLLKERMAALTVDLK
jgi:hypothetical protein